MVESPTFSRFSSSLFYTAAFSAVIPSLFCKQGFVSASCYYGLTSQGKLSDILLWCQPDPNKGSLRTNISLLFPCCPLSVVGTYASQIKQTESHLVFSVCFLGVFCLVFVVFFVVFVFVFFKKFPFPIIGENEVCICCFGHKIVVVRLFCMLGLMMCLLKIKYCF